jgi:ribonuclease VapC
MIVDTSALIAVLFAESDADLYAGALDTADVCRMSAANLLETSLVIDRETRQPASRQLDALIRSVPIVIEPVTEEQAHVARQAYADFGKGRHRAGLNFGDCFAYALATVSGEPLLFKGSDFRHTDVPPAI